MVVKIKVGVLESSRGGVLTAKLDRMETAGNEFVKIKAEVPAPPGFAAETLTLYSPRKLSLQKVLRDKYELLNEGTGTVLDKDEDVSRKIKEDDSSVTEEGESESGHMLVKIPTSYLDRWVHIVANESSRIMINETDVDSLAIEGEDADSGLGAMSKIFHPMLKRLIDSVNWHDNLEAYDYVYSVSRAYLSRVKSNATLFFRDNEGDFGIGRYFLTEGVSIVLDPKTVKSTVISIKEEMLSNKNKWAPSILKAYTALLSQLRLSTGAPLSPFKIDDLIGTLITAISSELDCRSVYQLSETLEQLLQDEQNFRKVAEQYYRGKYLMGEDETDESASERSRQEMMDIQHNVNQLLEFAVLLRGAIPKLEDSLDEWLVNTLLNTFAVSALSAMQRLVGSNDQSIGYTIDLEGLKKREYRMFLYDNTPNGNGSSDVLRRYLHILNIQRHGQSNESALLPSEDYFTLLEQELLQCPQFHTDMDALEKQRQKLEGEPAKGISEIAYVGEYSDEVLRVCEKTWSKLGVNSREDAWKLPLIAHSPGSFAMSEKLEVDDVIRASGICWNGCPECVINTGIMISAIGKSFLDKAVLDEWFKRGREKAEEYKAMPVADLATEKSIVDLGSQMRVVLKLPNRKIRAISLPYTIGFEIDREATSSKPKLVIRDNDIQNFRMFEKGAGRSAHGIESLGFKRIMWYNLLTTAYLDVLGYLEESRKEILLVFYDCRDVYFEDAGISHRMIEAIDYQRKQEGIRAEINSLSDILLWLAKRGFKIRLCVDEKKSQAKKVQEFLQILASEKANITVCVKKLPGLMHKKALLSPMGVIQGSANLTFSGTGLNEEIVNFAPFGVPEYEQMRVNIEDTFHGSKAWMSS
jgi:hypothetical protein